MAAVEMLAREYKFSVSPDGTVWTEIGGVNTWKWAEDTNEVNVTDFDDEGYEADLPATRKCKLTLEGNYLRDPETGERDAGQAMTETAARKSGFKALIHFKVESRDEDGANTPLGSITGKAYPKLNERGGGNQDKMPWSVELSVFGKPTFAGEFGGE